jgi:hypothetical protein
VHIEAKHVSSYLELLVPDTKPEKEIVAIERLGYKKSFLVGPCVEDEKEICPARTGRRKNTSPMLGIVPEWRRRPEWYPPTFSSWRCKPLDSNEGPFISHPHVLSVNDESFPCRVCRVVRCRDPFLCPPCTLVG